MTRLLVLAVLLTTTSIATANDDDDDYGHAGRRGTVTAYELDGRTVLSHKTCLSSGRHSWNYSRCSSRLRDTVKFKLCGRLGKGTHHYLYQLGDGRPSRSSVYCSRR